ncbi:MAG TPA: hypothetical protein VGD66_08870 [Allosphingosinicella sp.]
MVTVADIVLSSHQAVQAELRRKRPRASPWADAQVGGDDGSGYGFSNRTIRPFVRDCYRRIKQDPALSTVQARITMPPRLPAQTLLNGPVADLERWIASDVRRQVGL